MFALSSVPKRIAGFAFLFGFTILLGVILLTPKLVNAQTNPTLSSSMSFAVLGGSTVTNTGPSVVNGNLGVSPGSAVTGFPPGTLAPTATIHAGDATALQAQNDETAAYLTLKSESCPVPNDLTGQDLGGKTLTPGVYCFSSSAGLTGDLTLDAGGDPNAVFVFQIGSTLTTASNSRVLVTNGGSTCNVWWQVQSSATLGTTSSLAGNILALASITLTTGANVSGRAFAQTGAVTMDTNTVGSSACITLPPANPALSLTKDDGGVSVMTGHTVRYTLTFQNTGNVALNNVILSDAIPEKTTFDAGASTPGWNCSVSPCTFNLGTLQPGASGSVIFAVRVIDFTALTEVRNTATIASGATSATASDTTPVTTPVSPTSAPGATAVPPQSSTAVPTFVPSVPQATASSPLGSPQAAVGLPNTGGGAPQPTYWMGGSG